MLVFLLVREEMGRMEDEYKNRSVPEKIEG